MKRQPSYGRIDAETIQLLEDLTERVRREVLQALPASAPAEARKQALEAVLSVVMRDWSENGNTGGLEDEDIEDLKSFMKLAADLAGTLDGQGLVVFRTLLDALLEDWLENWNADGRPGPPKR